MGCALPSIRITSWPGGVSARSRNIQRCGMKLRVTPLSGLYSRIFIWAEFPIWGPGLNACRTVHVGFGPTHFPGRLVADSKTSGISRLYIIEHFPGPDHYPSNELNAVQTGALPE